MDSNYTILIIGVIIAIAGFPITYFIGKKFNDNKLAEAELKAKTIIVDAEKEGENIKKEKVREANAEWQKRKQNFDKESKSKKDQIKNQERELSNREEGLDKKLQTILKKEKTLHTLENDLSKKDAKLKEIEKSLDSRKDEYVKKLEEIANLSREEAKQKIMTTMEDEARKEVASSIKNIRLDAKERANREAQNIVVTAIQRTASDHSMENTVTAVILDSDEMKGRIIGKEGRNIRAFEAATGVDLIIDDTPEAVIISGFDPFRREVAKIALETLMEDGRIHPTRIEEVVEKANQDLLAELDKIGEEACLELDIHNMRPELMAYLGRMKFRTSYGQNLLRHSVEVAHVAGLMASQLGLNVKFAKRAALLHDVGKVADKEMEGPHALLSMEITKKYGEHPVIVNAVGSHHEDVEMESAIAVLTQAADSISGARPGARRESLENYTKRLENLEAIANQWEGIHKTYCIQAGREIRVIVEPDKVNDQAADEMARGIAAKIEAEMDYPGQIRVTIIRERRSSGIAK